MKTPNYLQPLETAFKKHADVGIAASMKKYMKDRYAHTQAFVDYVIHKKACHYRDRLRFCGPCRIQL